MAGRAGAMRAIAPSMPAHDCPRQGHLRPMPKYCAAGEVIDFALVAVYGIKLTLVTPARPLEVHAEVLCLRHRRRKYGSNMRRRRCAHRKATEYRPTTKYGRRCIAARDKTAPLYFRRVAVLLLGQRRGAAVLGELQ